jgi:hypothetical protein
MLKSVSSITNAIGALNYKGTWNASTNTPTLADGTGAKGDYYVVSFAGTQTFGGIQLIFGVGDWIVYNGSVWQRVEGGADGNFVNLSVDGRITTGTGVGAGSSATQITIGGTLVSASNVTRAVSNIGTAPSTSTTEFSSYLSAPSTTAAAYTITTLNHFIASFATLGATSAITNQFGHVAASTLTNATNNYGFYGNIASGTGRFNFYANGTAANVFAGTTSIGGLVGSESLRVNPTASAVNYVSIFGAVTLAQPSILVQGSDTNIGLTLASKGGSGLLLYTNSGANLQVVVAHTASAVNYHQFSGSATGSAIVHSAQGSDANIDIHYRTKGTGAHAFFTGNAGQFVIANTTSSVNYLQVTGGATGNATTLSAMGTDTNIDLALTTKGTGVLAFGTYTAGIIAQAGYITIKDAGGTTRRLLVG